MVAGFGPGLCGRGAGERFLWGLCVSGFPGIPRPALLWCVVAGVMGLLFENYIVDASILIRSNF